MEQLLAFPLGPVRTGPQPIHPFGTFGNDRDCNEVDATRLFRSDAVLLSSFL